MTRAARWGVTAASSLRRRSRTPSTILAAIGPAGSDGAGEPEVSGFGTLLDPTARPVATPHDAPRAGHPAAAKISLDSIGVADRPRRAAKAGSMRYVPLGDSGLLVSVVGLGCNNFGS